MSLYKLKILQPLKFQDFRWLFAAQLTNNFAKFLDYIALAAILVFQWHKGIITLTGFSIIYTIPMIISPLSGSLVDRWPLKRTMLISTSVVIICTFSLYFAPNYLWIIGIVLIRSFSKTFFTPSEKTLIKIIFPKEMLIKANSLVQLSLQLFRILGPIFGVCFLLFFTPKLLFIITGLIYMLSFIFIFHLPEKFNSSHKRKNSYQYNELFKDIAIIFKVFYSNYRLIIAYTAVTLASFAFFLSESLNIIFARKIGFSCNSFQLIMMAMGAGCVISSLILSKKKKDTNLIKLILLSMLTMGTIFVLISILCPVFKGSIIAKILFLTFWFIIGICISAMTIPYSVIIMKELSQDMIGRAGAMGSLSCGLSVLVAPITGAILAKLISIHFTFAISGIFMVFVAMLIIFLLKFKDHKTVPA